jgi:hypothetical protein
MKQQEYSTNVKEDIFENDLKTLISVLSSKNCAVVFDFVAGFYIAG